MDERPTIEPAGDDLVRALSRVLDGDTRGLASGDMDALVDAAHRHGVGSLAWQALSASAGEGLVLRQRLEPSVLAAVARELLRQAELRRVLRAVALGGGRVVVFKGSALAYTAYAQPWMRPRTDTDLLGASTDASAITAALVACGYARSDALSTGTLVSHQVAFERTDPSGLHHVIDLHWKVVNPQVLADAIAFEEIWDHSRPAVALGPDARVPAPVHSTLIACVHRLAHHQQDDRLIWLHDLKLLAGSFNAAHWEAFANLAAGRRVSAICLDGLSASHRRLGLPLPSELVERLRDAGRSEPSRVYVTGAVQRRHVLASDLAELRSWRARWALIREHAFPPAAYMRQKYGVTSGHWLPPLYARRLLAGAWKWLRV